MQQPTLPPEVDFTDAEFTFRDDEPRRLFPENQDSNWGLKRKIFSDIVADIHAKLYLIYGEMFPQTAINFLDEWERLVGLPRNPIGMTIQDRRALVMARLQQGPFTRSRREKIVRSFIDATFGVAIKLLPEGVALVPEGVPIYNDTPDGEYFRIIEEVETYYYEIQILRTISGINEQGMRNALEYVQYSGLHFNIVFVDSFGLFSQESDFALVITASNEATPPTEPPIAVDAYGYGAYGSGAYRALESYETDTALDLVATVEASGDYGIDDYGEGDYGE